MNSQTNRRPALAPAPMRLRLFQFRPPGLPILALGNAALADVLFFRQWVGWTLGGFFLVVSALLLVRHAHGLARQTSAIRVAGWAALALGLVVSMVAEPGALSFLLMLVLIGVLLTNVRDGGAGRPLGWGWMGRFFVFWGTLWARPIQDAIVARRWHSRRGKELIAKGLWLMKMLFLVAGVVVPVVLGLIFLGLFASANPVIAKWLGARFEDLWRVIENITDYITFARVFLWLIVAVGLWGLLRYRRRPDRRRYARPAPSRPAPGYLAEQNPWGEVVAVAPEAGSHAHAAPGQNGPSGHAWSAWLAQQAVRLTVKTLVVLNVVFLAQLVLDARYLVLGSALPEGMTYAEYAHRGAYPLVVTAILAGGLVLAVFRPSGAAERSAWARWLVLGWIVQNVALMLTAVWRLGMYVEVYSLTRLRVAAGVWMLMVAGGLVLLLWRIARRRDNTWLTGRTMVWGFAVLYACCFVPFDPAIASYNVDRCQEMGGPAGPIDVAYLETLGPDALPAIDRLLAEADEDRLEAPSTFQPSFHALYRHGRGGPSYAREAEPSPLRLREVLMVVREDAAEELDSRLSGWRGWTVRRAWLAAGAAEVPDASRTQRRRGAR